MCIRDRVWAAVRLRWTEDCGVWAKASVWRAVTRNTCNARVSGRNKDGDTLKAELHELVALTSLVVFWQVLFLFTITDRHDVGRLVDTALELALVAFWRVVVRIGRV